MSRVKILLLLLWRNREEKTYKKVLKKDLDIFQRSMSTGLFVPLMHDHTLEIIELKIEKLHRRTNSHSLTSQHNASIIQLTPVSYQTLVHSIYSSLVTALRYSNNDEDST